MIDGDQTLLQPRRPRLLTIAGSDSGGGAGIQADIKTFEAFGAYGMTAITSVTAQNTLGVDRIQLIEPSVVTAQIDACFEDIGVDAVKIGMLGSAEIVEAVAASMRQHCPSFLVVDPVMVSTAGARLLEEEAEDALRAALIPLASLVTPNVYEGAILAGLGSDSERDPQRIALELADRWERRVPVFLTGGDSSEAWLTDILIVGGQMTHFRHQRIESSSTHGTGCTLSAAIATLLARGETLERAVERAIEFVERAMRFASPGLGRGKGPLCHSRGLGS